MNKLTTMLALAGAALLPLTAHAASTATAATGDFILGFQTASPNTGSTFNLEVDLGSYASFTALEGTGQTVNLTLGTNTAGFGAFSLADVTSTYGATPTALNFGVEGSLGSAGNNETFISALSGTPPKKATFSEGVAMQTIYAGFNPTNDTNATPGSTDTIVSSTAPNSYGTIAHSDGHYNGNFTFATQAVFSLAGSESLTLFDNVNNVGPTKIGVLTLDDGVLTFTGTAAVPEPSTYAMMAAGLLLLVAIRRWKAQNA